MVGSFAIYLRLGSPRTHGQTQDDLVLYGMPHLPFVSSLPPLRPCDLPTSFPSPVVSGRPVFYRSACEHPSQRSHYLGLYCRLRRSCNLRIPRSPLHCRCEGGGCCGAPDARAVPGNIARCAARDVARGRSAAFVMKCPSCAGPRWPELARAC